MKNFYLPILLFLCICTVAEAQESRFLHHTSERTNLILISTGVGMNFDFLHTGGENALTALADRKTGFPVIDFRLEHFFSKRWGWFADIKLGIPLRYSRNYGSELAKSLEADYYVDNFAFERERPGVSPCMATGVAYRIEYSRWAIYPRLGIGVNNVSYQSVCLDLKKKGGNELYTIRYDADNDYGESNMDVFILSVGMSVNYKLAKYCYLVFNAAFAQPIGKRSSIEYQKKDLYTNEIVERRLYKANTLGRDINISLGVGIPIYFGRGIKTGKGGTTRKERMRGIMEQKRESYGLFPTTKKKIIRRWDSEDE